MNSSVWRKIHKDTIVASCITNPSKGHKKMTFNKIPTCVYMLSGILNSVTTILGRNIEAVPFAIYTKNTCSKDCIIPSEGIGNDSISCTTTDLVSVVVSDDDNFIVPLKQIKLEASARYHKK